MIEFIKVLPLTLSRLLVPKTIPESSPDSLNPCDSPTNVRMVGLQLKVKQHHLVRAVEAPVKRFHPYLGQFTLQPSAMTAPRERRAKVRRQAMWRQ